MWGWGDDKRLGDWGVVENETSKPTRRNEFAVARRLFGTRRGIVMLTKEGMAQAVDSRWYYPLGE